MKWQEFTDLIKRYWNDLSDHFRFKSSFAEIAVTLIVNVYLVWSILIFTQTLNPLAFVTLGLQLYASFLIISLGKHLKLLLILWSIYFFVSSSYQLGGKLLQESFTIWDLKWNLIGLTAAVFIGLVGLFGLSELSDSSKE